MPRKRKPTKPRLKRVTVRPEPRTEPDWERFAWAVLQHSRHLGEAGRSESPEAEQPGTEPTP
jgi:hypothetical protein